MKNLDKLKKRVTFVFGELNLPTPDELVLVKLSEDYLTRRNRKFDQKYIVGKLEVKGNKPYFTFQGEPNRYSYGSKGTIIQCSWSKKTIEKWYLIEDIEKLLK